VNGCQILELNSANICIVYQGLVVKWTENVIVYNEYEIIRYARNEYEIIRYVMVVAVVKALAKNSQQNLKTAVTMPGT